MTMSRIDHGFVLLTALVVMTASVTRVRCSCEPCECYPTMTEPSYMICQGWTVDMFPPVLGHYEKQFLKEIFLTETLIACPPAVLPDEYPSLTHFGENNNRLMNCSCLLSWKAVVPEEGFVSECVWHPPPVSTTTTSDNDGIGTSSVVIDDKASTTGDNKDVEEEDQTSASAGAAGTEGPGGCCCSSSIGAGDPPTSPLKPPSTSPLPPPSERRAIWIVIGVFSPIALLIIVIRGVKACYDRWKIRRLIREVEMPMQIVRNPIYRDPVVDLEWDALVDEQSRQPAIALGHQPAHVGASSC